MSKNILETEGPQMTSQYGLYALRAGLARLYTHMHMSTRPGTHMHTRTHAQACTHRPIRNTYCFSTATTVSQTRLNITLYVRCLSCFLYPQNWLSSSVIWMGQIVCFNVGRSAGSGTSGGRFLQKPTDFCAVYGPFLLQTAFNFMFQKIFTNNDTAFQ
jgi:hypothetical protein